MSEIKPPAMKVIAKIGTKKRVADLLQVDPSVISRWTDVVPSHHQRKLMELNEAEGLGLVYEDFFFDPPNEQRKGAA